MNDVVLDDIAREKQKELARQIAWTEAELTKLTVTEEELRHRSQLVLGLAADCYGSYTRSQPPVRRLWNQAWFEAIEVDIDDADGVNVDSVRRTPVAEAVRDDVRVIRRRTNSGGNERTTDGAAVDDSNVGTSDRQERTKIEQTFLRSQWFELATSGGGERTSIEPCRPLRLHEDNQLSDCE